MEQEIIIVQIHVAMKNVRFLLVSNFPNAQIQRIESIHIKFLDGAETNVNSAFISCALIN